MSRTGTYSVTDLLELVYDGPKTYVYWEVLVPGGTKVHEFLPELDTSGKNPVYKAGENDASESRRHLERILDMLGPGRYQLKAWASPNGKHGALNLPFEKAGDAAEARQAAGIGSTQDSAISQLLTRIDGLQEQIQQMHAAQLEKERRAEIAQLRAELAQAKSWEAKVLPIAGLLLDRLTPAGLGGAVRDLTGIPSVSGVGSTGTDLNPAMMGSSASASAYGSDAVEVNLTEEQIEQAQQAVIELLRREGPRGLDKLNSLNP
jgi:hypothetical protein